MHRTFWVAQEHKRRQGADGQPGDVDGYDHPDAKLEPLRSAEPPRPSEEERAELERSTRSEPVGQRETGRGDGAGAGEQPERERKPEREERAEAGPEREEPKPERETQAEPDTPGWVTELAERNRAAMAKIEEYRGLRVPSEDHEWEDEGEAWPQVGRLERDAVLQPPKPEIQPAPEVTEQAAQMAGADHEAGE